MNKTQIFHWKWEMTSEKIENPHNLRSWSYIDFDIDHGMRTWFVCRSCCVPSHHLCRNIYCDKLYLPLCGICLHKVIHDKCQTSGERRYWELGDFSTHNNPHSHGSWDWEGTRNNSTCGIVVSGPWRLPCMDLCDFSMGMGSCYKIRNIRLITLNMVRWGKRYHWKTESCTLLTVFMSGL